MMIVAQQNFAEGARLCKKGDGKNWKLTFGHSIEIKKRKNRTGLSKPRLVLTTSWERESASVDEDARRSLRETKDESPVSSTRSPPPQRAHPPVKAGDRKGRELRVGKPGTVV